MTPNEMYKLTLEVELNAPDEVAMDGTAYIGDHTVMLETYEGVQIIVPFETLKKLVSHPQVEDALDGIFDLGW